MVNAGLKRDMNTALFRTFWIKLISKDLDVGTLRASSDISLEKDIMKDENVDYAMALISLNFVAKYISWPDVAIASTRADVLTAAMSIPALKILKVLLDTLPAEESERIDRHSRAKEMINEFHFKVTTLGSIVRLDPSEVGGRALARLNSMCAGFTTLLECFRNDCITDVKENYEAGFSAVTEMLQKTKDLAGFLIVTRASDVTTARLAEPYEDFYAEKVGSAASYCVAVFELDDRFELLHRIMSAFGVPLTRPAGLVDMLRDATCLQVAQTLTKLLDVKTDPKRSDLVKALWNEGFTEEQRASCPDALYGLMQIEFPKLPKRPCTSPFAS